MFKTTFLTFLRKNQILLDYISNKFIFAETLKIDRRCIGH